MHRHDHTLFDEPALAEDAVVDPHFAGLLAAGTLPGYYQPPSMPRQFDGWRRSVVWVVITLLLTTASAGICVTYGPEELWRVVTELFG